MTAPIRAQSLRDSLAKTVRLLTRDGIQVQFRGHQPHVVSRGNKAIRLVLPELNDSAPPELIEAIQGFLDHEVGHIFYTPFARNAKFGGNDRTKKSLANIIEDIRLEKLLPRDLPGSKDNLQRMYERSIPMMFAGPAAKGVTSANANDRFCAVMVIALRAMAGQKEFQKHMDDNNYWPHFMPLVSKMPDLSRRLRQMETFDDVEGLGNDIIEATKPPAPARPEPKEQKPPKEEAEDKPDAQDGLDDKSEESKPDEEESKDEADSDDGEGHGDGEGTDDEEDDADAGDSSGEDDEAGDDSGSGGDDDDADADDDDGGDDDSEGDDGEGDADDKDDGRSQTETDSLDSSPDGNRSITLTDALKMLEATQRRALFLYKKRKQTVAQIASEMKLSEDDAIDLIRAARRRLSEILSGEK